MRTSLAVLRADPTTWQGMPGPKPAITVGEKATDEAERVE